MEFDFCKKEKRRKEKRKNSSNSKSRRKFSEKSEAVMFH
jgi:hypothetical protein